MRKRRNQKGNKGRPAAAAHFFEERGEKMPTKSNNTGGRGGARPGAGRKKSAVREKAENGNPGGRRLEVLDIPEVEGVDMPKPHEFLSAEQRDGSTLQAEEIYTETWEWLKKVGCAANEPLPVKRTVKKYKVFLASSQVLLAVFFMQQGTTCVSPSASIRPSCAVLSWYCNNGCIVRSSGQVLACW